ncbi:Twin-arginine translocation protein TatC [Actinomycetales bacterium JB111]|nr:Twin-arginine translocation protein TatC [Actinomycetales bacterium JB111]
MPLRAHLGELRRRLLFALAGVLLGAIAGWFFSEPVINLVAEPLQTARPGQPVLTELNFGTLGSGFDLRLQVAIVLGIIGTAPWWIGQLWLYLVPALKRREKWITVAFVLSGTVLFLAGAALAWWLVPHVVDILTDLVPASGTSLIDARTYLAFVMRLLIVFGVAFLLPIVLIGLTTARLVRARTYLKGWRWAVIGAFVFAAFANPLPDAWSMIGMAMPILLLYFGAIGVCALIEWRRARRAARTTPDDDATTPDGAVADAPAPGPSDDAGRTSEPGATERAPERPGST